MWRQHIERSTSMVREENVWFMTPECEINFTFIFMFSKQHFHRRIYGGLACHDTPSISVINIFFEIKLFSGYDRWRWLNFSSSFNRIFTIGKHAHTPPTWRCIYLSVFGFSRSPENRLSRKNKLLNEKSFATKKGKQKKSTVHENHESK